jgi:ABC-type nitrate/sulfonate/bicarbonate transport system ATPase subunit
MSYQGTPVIEDISIRLQAGELVGLLGVSGSGKSTLFNVISGLTPPDRGSILLEGSDVTGQTGMISYMQQKDLLLPHRNVLDNVALPLLLRGEKLSSARASARGMLPQFGLEGSENKYPEQLSGGMRQRAALLRTHLFGSRVALLDEPFSALDAITKRRIHKWYLELVEELGMSTLFITHDVDEAILLSDRLYIMTGVPGKIRHEIVISEPRPRHLDFNTTENFLQYKRKILEFLHL